MSIQIRFCSTFLDVHVIEIATSFYCFVMQRRKLRNCSEMGTNWRIYVVAVYSVAFLYWDILYWHSYKFCVQVLRLKLQKNLDAANSVKLTNSRSHVACNWLCNANLHQSYTCTHCNSWCSQWSCTDTAKCNALAKSQSVTIYKYDCNNRCLCVQTEAVKVKQQRCVILGVKKMLLFWGVHSFLTLGNMTVAYSHMVTHDNKWWRRSYAISASYPLDSGFGENWKQWEKIMSFLCITPVWDGLFDSKTALFLVQKNVMTLLTCLPKVDTHDGWNIVGEWPCQRHFNIWLRALMTRCWWDATLPW